MVEYRERSIINVLECLRRNEIMLIGRNEKSSLLHAKQEIINVASRGG